MGATQSSLRADLDPKDVMRVMNGIWYLSAGSDWRENVGRLLHLIIDGLRYGAAGQAYQLGCGS